MSFPQAFYVLTFFIEIDVSAEIMRKSLSTELKHLKIVLNTYVLRKAKPPYVPHGIMGMSEWVSQIGKNPQMKVVLIFLHVPVFSSVGWLSYTKHIIFLFSSFFFFFPFFFYYLFTRQHGKSKVIRRKKTIDAVSS